MNKYASFENYLKEQPDSAGRLALTAARICRMN